MRNPAPLPDRPRIALFATCLVNNFYPDTGFASARLLELAGYPVSIPQDQTCCGQPNYNNGDPTSAITAAKHFIRTFSDYDVIVVPSSSCAGMIINHYPRLLKGDSEWETKALAIANRSWEIVDFLSSHALDRLPVNESFNQPFCHHHSCSSLREVQVSDQVNKLLSHCLPNATRKQLSEPETCCGFGGTFSIKQPAIATKLAKNKIQDAMNTGTSVCTTLDTGCKWHLQNNNNQKSFHLEHLLEYLYSALRGSR